LGGNSERLAVASFNAARMNRDPPGLGQDLLLAKGLGRD